MDNLGGEKPPNPLEPAVTLVGPQESSLTSLDEKRAHPQDVPMVGDSATTKAEKYERHGIEDIVVESPSKKRRLENREEDGLLGPTKSERQKGVAPIKPESVR